MATKEDIDLVLKLFHENRPQHAFDEMKRGDSGILAVLKFLHFSPGEVRSKDISNSMHISSARMAVILKNMEKKNLITKSTSTTDARSTIITLTETGQKTAEYFQSQIINAIECIVDEFGIEHLYEMFRDMNRIKEIMEESIKEITEEQTCLRF